MKKLIMIAAHCLLISTTVVAQQAKALVQLEQHQTGGVEMLLKQIKSAEQNLIEKKEKLALLRHSGADAAKIQELAQEVHQQVAQLGSLQESVHVSEVVSKAKPEVWDILETNPLKQVNNQLEQQLGTSSNFKVKEMLEGEIKNIIVQEKPNFQEALFYEIDLGVSNNNLNLVRISPLLGYQLSERFALGVGPMWQRLSNPQFNIDQLFSRMMGRMQVVKNVFALQVENVTNLSPNLPETTLGHHAQFLGGQLQLPTGKNHPINLTLLKQVGNSPTATYLGNWQMKMGLTF